MRNHTRNLILAALFAALTAVGTFMKIPLGAMAVTLQFFFTALAGILLGPQYGALSQVVYVALGLVGLPIFTLGGGLGYMLQPSFGFLLGLIPAAWTVGIIARGSGRRGRVCLSCIAGLAVLYLVGLPYMYLVFHYNLQTGMTFSTVVQVGMLVYLPGDALKIAVTALLARPLTRALAPLQTA